MSEDGEKELNRMKLNARYGKFADTKEPETREDLLMSLGDDVVYADTDGLVVKRE